MTSGETIQKDASCGSHDDYSNLPYVCAKARRFRESIPADKYNHLLQRHLLLRPLSFPVRGVFTHYTMPSPLASLVFALAVVSVNAAVPVPSGKTSHGNTVPGRYIVETSNLSKFKGARSLASVSAVA